MRAVFVAVAAITSACSLDIDSKPECVEDGDCATFGHCVEYVCYGNTKPVGQPDLVYVSDPNWGPFNVVVDVVANDADADGDVAYVKTVNTVSGGAIARVDDNRVSITADVPRSMYAYRLSDDRELSTSWIDILVIGLPSHVDLRLANSATQSLASLFENIEDADLAKLELLTPPLTGTLVGTLPDVSYVASADACGYDTFAYRFNAPTGPIDIAVTVDVGLEVSGESAAVPFSRATTVDVTANDPADTEIIAVDSAFASITDNGKTLTIAPPAVAPASYAINYTLRNSRGCERSAVVTLSVTYPTDVVVGPGLSDDSFDGVLSHDGRYLAFTSAAANLVANDTNSASDVFVKDLVTGTVERISVASNGAQANESSGSATISADGRYVAFVSRATNLDAADTTSIDDIYLHDRNTDTTVLVSRSVDNTGSDDLCQLPHISSNGSRIVYLSRATRLVANDSNNGADVFLRDVTAGTTTRLASFPANMNAVTTAQGRPRISGNGRYVVTEHFSPTTGETIVSLIDTSGGAVTKLSNRSSEVDIDDSGRHIALEPPTSSDLALLDRVVDTTTKLDGSGASFASMSSDGAYVSWVYGNDIRSRRGNTYLAVNVDPAGNTVAATPLRRPEMSGDGRWVVFATSSWPGHVGRFVIVRVWNRAYTP